MDLYFEDYIVAVCFCAAQNYLNVQSRIAKNVYQELELISKTADSLSLSDLVDRDIRSKQQWSLLPIRGLSARCSRGISCKGSLQKQIEFPVWLGKNSTTNKNKRLIEETGSYASSGEDGIEEVVNFVNSYDLLREDMEPIMDVTTWEG
ncbi:hypothetical protein BV898_01932 [Hypsibius exemplaris]|uniref:DNA replication factor RFC1 C-terminal domain-containing protein n=1 Tax=Hypsibius exemplaris TaxID=2072580 RepID=A0A1W0XA43_HYPEX|nr:hypothetical protein BV898_01932 [Hypsibius exemplaris]